MRTDPSLWLISIHDMTSSTIYHPIPFHAISMRTTWCSLASFLLFCILHICSIFLLITWILLVNQYTRSTKMLSPNSHFSFFHVHFLYVHILLSCKCNEICTRKSYFSFYCSHVNLYMHIYMVLFFSLSSFFSIGCCFVTFFTRKAALNAQDALHNVKTLVGVSIC